MRLPMIGVVGVLVCLVVGTAVALGAGSSGTPAGGRIQAIVQPGQGQGNGKVLLTGAVGDYGTTHGVTTGGKKIAMLTLKKGTIKVDITAISAKTNNANPSIDAATCSGYVDETAPSPVVSGTGLYAGIHGTLKITETFGFIGSTYKSGSKKGQCDMSQSARTLAQMGVVYGTGTVSF